MKRPTDDYQEYLATVEARLGEFRDGVIRHANKSAEFLTNEDDPNQHLRHVLMLLESLAEAQSIAEYTLLDFATPEKPKSPEPAKILEAKR